MYTNELRYPHGEHCADCQNSYDNAIKINTVKDKTGTVEIVLQVVHEKIIPAILPVSLQHDCNLTSGNGSSRILPDKAGKGSFTYFGR